MSKFQTTIHRLLHETAKKALGHEEEELSDEELIAKLDELGILPTKEQMAEMRAAAFEDENYVPDEEAEESEEAPENRAGM